MPFESGLSTEGLGVAVCNGDASGRWPWDGCHVSMNLQCVLLKLCYGTDREWLLVSSVCGYSTYARIGR